jgi:hypothetical protein
VEIRKSAVLGRAVRDGVEPPDGTIGEWPPLADCERSFERADELHVRLLPGGFALGFTLDRAGRRAGSGKSDSGRRTAALVADPGRSSTTSTGARRTQAGNPVPREERQRASQKPEGGAEDDPCLNVFGHTLVEPTAESSGKDTDDKRDWQEQRPQSAYYGGDDGAGSKGRQDRRAVRVLGCE